MTTIRIKIPTIEQVEFSLKVEEEEIPVRGNAIDTGNREEDRKYEKKILDRLDAGDVWAWCSVLITCEWRGLKGYASLGCCCYTNEADFKNNSLHYEEMRQEAYADLLKKIEALKG